MCVVRESGDCRGGWDQPLSLLSNREYTSMWPPTARRCASCAENVIDNYCQTHAPMTDGTLPDGGVPFLVENIVLM